jgi:hypothetical protein
MKIKNLLTTITITIGLLGFAFIDCNENPAASNSQSTSLSGTVINTAGDKLENVRIITFPDSQTTFTDEHGYFFIDSIGTEFSKLHLYQKDYNAFETTLTLKSHCNNTIGPIVLSYRIRHILTIMETAPFKVANNSRCSMSIRLEEATIKDTIPLSGKGIRTDEYRPYYSYLNESDSLIMTDNEGVAVVQYELAVPNNSVQWSFTTFFAYESARADITINVTP